MPTVYRRPQAVRDLADQATYLYLADPISDVSERFLSAAEQAFTRLAEMPGVGVVYSSPTVAQSNIRRWAVPGFKNHLIFYRQTADGVEILRVLHGARDIDRLFEEGDV